MAVIGVVVVAKPYKVTFCYADTLPFNFHEGIKEEIP